MTVTLDKKDHKIIEILRKDSRSSIRTIAKLTAIRPSTVHQRITKLVKNKIIERFTLKLNNEALGEGFIALLQMSTTEDLPKTFFKNKHIKEAFTTTGDYDLILKLKFNDIAEFNDYIIGLRKAKAITKTTTTVSTKVLKE